MDNILNRLFTDSLIKYEVYRVYTIEIKLNNCTNIFAYTCSYLNLAKVENIINKLFKDYDLKGFYKVFDDTEEQIKLVEYK